MADELDDEFEALLDVDTAALETDVAADADSGPAGRPTVVGATGVCVTAQG
jgi:hypothetical protein